MIHNFEFFYRSLTPFSNWYMSPFTHAGNQYNCSEQFMMYSKACLFNDFDVAKMIMEQRDPYKQKFLGRQVRGYDDPTWLAECENIMIPGLKSKFLQNQYCLKRLLDTGDKILVEASPADKLWGIGLDESDPRALDQTQWLGKNLLGKCLMKVRDEIRS